MGLVMGRGAVGGVLGGGRASGRAGSVHGVAMGCSWVDLVRRPILVWARGCRAAGEGGGEGGVTGSRGCVGWRVARIDRRVARAGGAEDTTDLCRPC